MMCTNCSHMNADYSIFCGICGLALRTYESREVSSTINLESGTNSYSFLDLACWLFLGVIEFASALM